MIREAFGVRPVYRRFRREAGRNDNHRWTQMETDMATGAAAGDAR